jgi:hypothetical protein
VILGNITKSRTVFGFRFSFVFETLVGYLSRGLRQSNNLKTIAKLENYKMHGIGTSHDKSRDFDLGSLISCLTLTAKFSLTIDKIYFVLRLNNSP